MDNKSTLTLIIGLFIGAFLASGYFSYVEHSAGSAAKQGSEQTLTDTVSNEVSLLGNTPQPAISGYDSELASSDELQNIIDQLRMEVETLRLENDDLRQRSMVLAESADHNEKKYSDVYLQLRKLTSENERLTRELGQFAESEITDEQMSALLAEPFSNFLLGFKGQQRDEIYDFFQQPEDHEWGYDMQLKISDFIESHEYRDDVSLTGVTCKIDRCEVRIIEADPSLGHFNIMFQQLRQQPWWEFTSTHSTSGNSGEGGMKIFFYLKV